MDTLHPRLGKYILLEGLKTWQVHFIGRPEITWKVNTSSTIVAPTKLNHFELPRACLYGSGPFRSVTQQSRVVGSTSV